MSDQRAEYVRQYLRANLFDGDEGGVVTQPISALLDELVEAFMELQIDGKVCG